MSIVVGFITTNEGRAALKVAVSEALMRHARLIVLMPASPRGDTHEIAAAEAELAADVASAGVELESRVMAPDADPGEELIRVADEVDAARIVIGLRRRSPVGKLILGANAQRVLLDATCPVLAVTGEA